MRRKILVLILTTLLLIPLASVTILAHPGRTDANGGHWDHSNGTYHYHHGHSAHSHPNGECQYKQDVLQNTSSYSSNSSNSSNSSDDFGFGDFMLAILFVAVIIGIVFIAKYLLDL